MKRVYILPALALLLVSLLAPAGVFASCAGPFTIQEYVNMADVVVSGTVRGEEYLGYFNLHVDRYYKGTGPEKIGVSGRQFDNGGITSVDYDLKPDQRYLLFLKKVNSNYYKTNDCSGNKIIEEGKIVLTSEEAAVLGIGTPAHLTQRNAILASENLGWLVAIIGFGYVLPIMLVLSGAFLVYMLFKLARRRPLAVYQIVLLVVAAAYVVFYFYIQRVI